ncbi:MAG: aminoglycoside adenylyltransferase family protein [Alcaligenaceae bacterium]|nr:aminoglycoside adenylyltransferase family protein [Alcaligenaceae bacterium]
MTTHIPNDISSQLSQTLALIQAHFGSSLLAVHLYGSALDGGLQRYSDIDLLVTISELPQKFSHGAFYNELLTISAPPGEREDLRALEITVLLHHDVVPWHYPARRALQFGEWQRSAILAGVLEPATVDPDLAILLTKVRHKSIALIGAQAASLFEPIPETDMYQVLADTLTMWNEACDWSGDERNVILTLARMWYTAETGEIIPKDAAADWVLERLPAEHHAILQEAKLAYLGRVKDDLAAKPEQVTSLILYLKEQVAKSLEQH